MRYREQGTDNILPKIKYGSNMMSAKLPMIDTSAATFREPLKTLAFRILLREDENQERIFPLLPLLPLLPANCIFF